MVISAPSTAAARSGGSARTGSPTSATPPDDAPTNGTHATSNGASSATLPESAAEASSARTSTDGQDAASAAAARRCVSCGREGLFHRNKTGRCYACKRRETCERCGHVKPKKSRGSRYCFECDDIIKRATSTRVPALPLAKKVDDYIEARMRETFGTDIRRDEQGRFLGASTPSTMQLPSEALFCESLGVGDRQLRRWRDGAMVKESQLDQFLTESPWCWWEIWNEETVRKAILPVTVYRMEGKRKSATVAGNGSRHGEVYTCPCTHEQFLLPDSYQGRYRVKVKRTGYGDAGPDYDELQRIERLFTGGEE